MYSWGNATVSGWGLVLCEEGNDAVFHYSIERSCRFLIVMMQESAERFALRDRA
ncbi:MAG: hypothetical protein IH830_11130 [Planctomycetes bacterium]|nr:hypothetical protein [Planctomycetota bacterium]